MTETNPTAVDLLQIVYDKATDRVIAVDPPWPVLRTLARALDGQAEPVQTDLLLSEAGRATLADHFAFATRFAEFIEDGSVRIGALQGIPSDRLLLARDYAVALLHPSPVVGIDTDDHEVTAALFDHYGAVAKEAAAHDLSQPSQARLLETAAATFGPAYRADLETALSLEQPFDPVVLSLLLGATHDELLFDLSRWGEALGLASIATFSRRKTDLEEQGHLQTEAISQDVGRPRQRLQLGQSFDGSPAVSDLVAIAGSR